MKHDQLRSIAHNIADSLASGSGLMIGYFPTDVFAEAGNAPEGHLIVDFLTGEIWGARPTPRLAEAVALYRDVLPCLCAKHGAFIAEFRELTARYSRGVLYSRFIVTIEDTRGRRSSAEYDGCGGRRLKVLDHLGRVRATLIQAHKRTS
jgi:hypothetical protein